TARLYAITVCLRAVTAYLRVMTARLYAETVCRAPSLGPLASSPALFVFAIRPARRRRSQGPPPAPPATPPPAPAACTLSRSRAAARLPRASGPLRRRPAGGRGAPTPG